MKFKSYLKTLAEKAVHRVKSSHPSFSAHSFRPGNDQCTLNYGEPEFNYQLSDGYHIPVYRQYRYSVKKCWLLTDEIVTMNQLRVRKQLLSCESREFASFVGSRSLLAYPEKFRELLITIVKNRPSLFESASIERDCTNPIPLFNYKTEIAQIKYFEDHHEKVLDKISRCSFGKLMPGDKILEIGFTSGGHSLFAWEKKGLKIYGLDNLYGNQRESESSTNNASLLKTAIQSAASLKFGDITKLTPFEDNYFDCIYSTSVLEHIVDLVSAFNEMHRLLKPGGLLIHAYHPYHSYNGGHGIATADAPWGHLLMSKGQYIKYVQDLRPYESNVAKYWLNGCLFPEYSMSFMQQCVLNANFKIVEWKQFKASDKIVSLLTNSILKRCLKINPEISVQEILSTMVFFIAEK